MKRLSSGDWSGVLIGCTFLGLGFTCLAQQHGRSSYCGAREPYSQHGRSSCCGAREPYSHSRPACASALRMPPSPRISHPHYGDDSRTHSRRHFPYLCWGRGGGGVEQPAYCWQFYNQFVDYETLTTVRKNMTCVTKSLWHPSNG
jgi:hypothetical protein